jgi:AcrR family transcriptional regulator
MIESAALLMRENGVEATSFSDVMTHSGAPRGSIYHHFPEGKAQLVEEATRWAGEFIAAGVSAALEQGDPFSAVDTIASFWRAVLRDSDFAAGCPVVAATVDGARFPAARAVAGRAFKRWEDLATELLKRHEVREDQARSLATLITASIEGAVILARAQRSAEPLERVVEAIHMLLRGTVMPARSDG